MIRMRVFLLSFALALCGCGGFNQKELQVQITDLQDQLESARGEAEASRKKLEEVRSTVVNIADKSSDMQAAVADIANVYTRFGSENWQEVMPRMDTSINKLDAAAEELHASVQETVAAVE